MHEVKDVINVQLLRDEYESILGYYWSRVLQDIEVWYTRSDNTSTDSVHKVVGQTRETWHRQRKALCNCFRLMGKNTKRLTLVLRIILLIQWWIDDKNEPFMNA